MWRFGTGSVCAGDPACPSAARPRRLGFPGLHWQLGSAKKTRILTAPRITHICSRGLAWPPLCVFCWAAVLVRSNEVLCPVDHLLKVLRSRAVHEAWLFREVARAPQGPLNGCTSRCANESDRDRFSPPHARGHARGWGGDASAIQ
jgi:hypothetical protein